MCVMGMLKDYVIYCSTRICFVISGPGELLLFKNGKIPAKGFSVGKYFGRDPQYTYVEKIHNELKPYNLLGST